MSRKKSKLLLLRLQDRRQRRHVDGLVLRVGLVLGRADHDAQVAAGAVLRRDLDRVLPALELRGLVVHRLESVRRVLQTAAARRPWRGWRRAGRRRRTCCTGCRPSDPRPAPRSAMVRFSHLRRAGRPGAVDGEGGHRQQIALAGHHHRRHALDEIRRRLGHQRRPVALGRHLVRHLHLDTDAPACDRRRRSCGARPPRPSCRRSSRSPS